MGYTSETKESLSRNIMVIVTPESIAGVSENTYCGYSFILSCWKPRFKYFLIQNLVDV